MSNSLFRRSATVAAVAASVAFTAPALAQALPFGSSDDTTPAAPGAACSTLSTEATPNGWGVPFDDEQDQKASYTDETVLDDDGGLLFQVTQKSERRAWYAAAGTEEGAVKLADVVDSEIGFEERADASHASFQIRLLGTTGGRFENGFTTLVWVAAGNDDIDTADGATHTGLQNGKWWSTQNIDGAKDRVPVSLATIAAANPDATVEHYGVSIGTGAENVTTLVDGITFNGCTTNFAKNDPEEAPATSGGSLANLFSS